MDEFPSFSDYSDYNFTLNDRYVVTVDEASKTGIDFAIVDGTGLSDHRIGLSCNTAIDDDSEEEEDDALEPLSREQKIKVISTPFEVSRRVSAEI